MNRTSPLPFGGTERMVLEERGEVAAATYALLPLSRTSVEFENVIRIESYLPEVMLAERISSGTSWSDWGIRSTLVPIDFWPTFNQNSLDSGSPATWSCIWEKLAKKCVTAPRGIRA